MIHYMDPSMPTWRKRTAEVPCPYLRMMGRSLLRGLTGSGSVLKARAGGLQMRIATRAMKTLWVDVFVREECCE